MIHLRLIVPAALGLRVTDRLVADPRVTNVVTLPGAAREPDGDLVLCDVAREAASQVVDELRAMGVDGEQVGLTIQEIAAAPTPRARRAEEAAPGSPDDGIVWDVVVSHAYADSGGSWSFHAFLVLATAIAAVAVVTDSAILVVGAMVVGPEFGPVAALALGLVLRRWGLVRRALTLLLIGFAVAIAVVAVLALAARLGGWVTVDQLKAPRPLTAYIWRPDRWSLVVALLAGCAGVLSLTAGRSNVLVGVFISVTTVPAAGNLALALGLWVPDEIRGSLEQLGINLLGMTVAGVGVLAVQRLLTRPRGKPDPSGA